MRLALSYREKVLSLLRHRRVEEEDDDTPGAKRLRPEFGLH